MIVMTEFHFQTPVTAYVEDRQSSEFFPTPPELIRRMLEKVNWDTIETVLEPSAGKGDIVRGIAKARYGKRQRDSLSIDCIEIDANLRAILKYNFSEDAKRAINKKKTAIINVRTQYEKQDWDTKEYLYFDSLKREYIPFPEDEQKQLAELDAELAGFIDDRRFPMELSIFYVQSRCRRKAVRSFACSTLRHSETRIQRSADIL